MRWFQLLLDCEKAGVNTWQASFNHGLGRQFPKIREAGCRIQFVCLAASWHFDANLPRTPEAVVAGTIRCAQAAAKHSPIGIVFHGGATDSLYRAGKLDMIRSYVNAVHDLGVPAGISTHNPVILEALEEKNYGNDFYMASMYYLTRRPEDWHREIGTQPVAKAIWRPIRRRCARFSERRVGPALSIRSWRPAESAARPCDSVCAPPSALKTCTRPSPSFITVMRAKTQIAARWP